MSDATAVYLRSLDSGLRPYAEAMVMSARAVGVPLVIISGRRSVEANREVGGAPTSRHLQGLAFDVAVEGYSRDSIPWWWWQILGEWWEGLGGRWGGRFNPPDVNHFDVG